MAAWLACCCAASTSVRAWLWVSWAACSAAATRSAASAWACSIFRACPRLALGQDPVPLGLGLGPVLLGRVLGGGDLLGGLRADPLQLVAGGGLVGLGPIGAGLLLGRVGSQPGRPGRDGD